MIWTLTFVAFMLTGNPQVGGSVFKTQIECESMRGQLLEAVHLGAIPATADGVVVGECIAWSDPKTSLRQ